MNHFPFRSPIPVMVAVLGSLAYRCPKKRESGCVSNAWVAIGLSNDSGERFVADNFTGVEGG